MTVAIAIAWSTSMPATAGDYRAVVQAADSSIASIHSDITFAITSAPKKDVACGAECNDMPDRVADKWFDAKVKQVAAILESGVRELFPDVEMHVPGASDGLLFDVFVADTEEWNTASSASGKIAVSGALAATSGIEDLLAYLIAREMAHVIAAHHERNSAASILTSLAMNVIVPGSGLVKSAVSLGGAAIASTANREAQERQADRLAGLILKASGYSVAEVAEKLVLFQSADWAPRLKASTHYIVASAAAKEVGQPAASDGGVPRQDAKTEEIPARQQNSATSAVVTYVTQGVIISATKEDGRKVAAAASRRTSYYDMN